MNKILLIGINARYTHLNLAIRYIRAYASDINNKIQIAEYTISTPVKKILTEVFDKQPEIIGLSVYIWNTHKMRMIISDIKKILPNVKLILGGPEVSYNSQRWLDKYPEIDFVISGSGEAGFRLLLENNFNYSNKIISIQNPSFKMIPFPYETSEFPDLKHKYIYYEASRGCRFKCSYCISSRFDQKFEYRELKTVIEELSFLMRQKPKIIKFIDRTFNFRKGFYQEIWKFLIGKNPKIKFHFEIHPALLAESDFAILEKCPIDLFQFEIGIQSTNYRALKAINRPQNWNNIAQKIERLIKMKTIHIHLDMIAGLPFEDFGSIKNSFNSIYSLKADHFQLGFLKILPGSGIQKSSKEFEIEYSKFEPYEILRNKWLSFADLAKLKLVEKALNLFYNSGKYNTFIDNLEDHFSNPFEMFLTLSEFRNRNIENQENKRWVSNAEVLSNFIKTRFRDDEDFLLDCLRWDWCMLANSHYYPEFINISKTVKAKGFQILKSDKYKFKDYLKKSAIFFSPSSLKFKKKFLEGYSIVAFIKTPEAKKIIKLQ